MRPAAFARANAALAEADPRKLACFDVHVPGLASAVAWNSHNRGGPSFPTGDRDGKFFSREATQGDCRRRPGGDFDPDLTGLERDLFLGRGAATGQRRTGLPRRGVGLNAPDTVLLVIGSACERTMSA